MTLDIAWMAAQGQGCRGVGLTGGLQGDRGLQWPGCRGFRPPSSTAQENCSGLTSRCCLCCATGQGWRGQAAGRLGEGCANGTLGGRTTRLHRPRCRFCLSVC